MKIHCKYDELVPWRSLKPHPKNRNKHPQDQIERLTKLIRYQGVRAPIVVSKLSGCIVKGHGTLAALKPLCEEFNVKTVPVAYQDFDDEEQEYLFVQSDNAIAAWAELDLSAINTDIGDLGPFDLDLLGLKDFTVDVSEKYGDADAIPDTPKQAKSKPGEMWLLGKHRLLCGNSTKRADVDRLMDGEKADCVFTSPPYAVGLDYGDTYEDTIQNLRMMLVELASLWPHILEVGGFATINFGDIASGRNIAKVDGPCEYPMALEYWPVFREAGWVLWSRRIWCKPNARVNSMWCIQSNRAATDWEHIWTWKAQGEALIKRVDGEFNSCRGWIDTSHGTGVEVGKETHGAGMATSIAEWMATVHCRSGQIVHEPFCGTGTTLVACEKSGRRCFAMEINPCFIDVILDRFAKYTGKDPVREDGTPWSKIKANGPSS